MNETIFLKQKLSVRMNRQLSLVMSQCHSVDFFPEPGSALTDDSSFLNSIKPSDHLRSFEASAKFAALTTKVLRKLKCWRFFPTEIHISQYPLKIFEIILSYLKLI